MAAPERPYSRRDYNRALIGNALVDPFAVVLLSVLAGAGVVFDALAVLLPVGLGLYGAAAARAYLDEDVAARVLDRERAQRHKAVVSAGAAPRPGAVSRAEAAPRPGAAPRFEAVPRAGPVASADAAPRAEARVDPAALPRPIGDLLRGALRRQTRIRQAVERAQLPYADVLGEVERFVRAMEATARRAQLLYEALAETPPPAVEARLAELTRENDPGRQELVQALTGQLRVLRRMGRQLGAFYDQMEKILVELDTVHGHLVSVSASTDAANQQQLAADVRGLRQEVGALAEGMSEAYEQPGPAAGGGRTDGLH